MNKIVSNKSKIEYFDTMNSYSYEELGKFIVSLLPKEELMNYTPIILCIGTDRATGDCLGPLVGEQLINYDSRFTVMGCLQAPVHALNIRETIYSINTEIENPFIIAVDASLGLVSHVGYITVSNEPILPGKGVNKRLPAIGDVSITGIVNVSGQSPGLLQSTRLYTVVQLANCIADALKYAIDYLDDFCPL
ncbi:MAG: spore protease YyaC [Lachnospiraceae bacterium]|nr:spore protease YyaC [Lachnospiraceae bacterium]